MGEQQPLHHSSMFNPIPNNRPPGAQFVQYPSYMAQAGSRLDGVGLSNPFLCYPFRPTDPMQYFARPSLYCTAYPQTDLTLATPAPEEFVPINVPSPYQSSVPYSHVLPNNQSVPISAASSQRSLGVSKSSAVTIGNRQRRPLSVIDPRTKAILDLESDLQTPEVSLEPPKNDSDILVEDSQTTPLSQPKTVTPVDTADEAEPTDMVDEQPFTDNPIDAEDHTAQCDPVVAIENGLSAEESCPETDRDIETDYESHIDSDDEDAVKGRRYNREIMLSLKNSPLALTQLKELEVVSQFYNIRRYNRAAQRTQRVIRLPTGITVKRIEDAFVPSSLRKKEGNTDPQKDLSKELNVILNRVSDGNLTETVRDIKKINIKTPDNLQLLATLTFQKAIRQLKYCKVFALLCKELKGFDVQGSGPFESLILRQVQELFNTPLETLITELHSSIDSKIVEAKDEDIKKIMEEDRETMVVKKTESYYGNISLLAELYLCRLVTPKTMIDCIKKLRESSAPESSNSMIVLFKSCGLELDQLSKSAVDSCFARLNYHVKSNKLPTHLVFKIQELIELRSRGWKEVKPDYFVPSQRDVAPRRTEDKPRLSHMLPVNEPKRRSVQSNNPVTPSNLAVTQQSCNSRILKPSFDNWAQGSGQLIKNLSETNPLNSQPNKPAPHSILSNRSREASPRISSGLPHAEHRSNPNMVNNTVPASRSQETYEDQLKQNAATARTIVALLSSDEEDPCAVVDECKKNERPALLHNVFDLVMEKSSKERNTFGNSLFNCLRRKLITPDQLISVCRRFFLSCDADWLEDYPLGLVYLGEIFQHLIQQEHDFLGLLVEILKPWFSDHRGSTVLAHCLKASALRLEPSYVGSRFQSLGLDWSKFGVPASDVNSFLEKYSIGFTLGGDTFDAKLKELAELTGNASSNEQIGSFFRSISSSSVSADFVRQCTETMIAKSKGFPRQDIDRLVTSLGILVDHNSERESQVLLGLHKCSQNNIPTDHWQKSLLDRKVISADAFRSWAYSTNGDKSIAKSIHIRNP